MKSNKNVLVVTPYSDYGDLICRSVSKLISGNIKIVSTIHAVAKYSDEFQETESSIDFVLMDLETGIEKAHECINIVRNDNPSVQIIMIAKNDIPEEIESLRPWNLLKKPFVENDLLEIIRSTLNQKNISVIDGKFLDSDNLQYPLWTRDKAKLNIIMRETLANLDAQEAILISEKEIIASVGPLQNKEMESCSLILNKYMDFSGHGELIKQVRLSDNIYLMHALVVAVGLIIALLFDPDTSYELIRGQTRHMAGKITHPALPDEGSKSVRNPYSKEKIGPGNRTNLAETIQVKKYPRISDFEQSRELYTQDGRFESGSLPLNLDDSEIHPGYQREFKNHKIEDKTNNKTKRPSIISVGLSQLPFTCLLIPRLNPLSISNEIIEFLEEKTPMIFLSYGWRLNDILIKKDMLQWIAAIPPIIAPAFQIKTIRKETSKLLFEKFPNLTMDGLMKDFWVPGYLVAIGSERITEIEKKEMIDQYHQNYFLDGPNTISTCAQKVLYNNY